MSVFMYTSVSSLNLLSLRTYICVCVCDCRGDSVCLSVKSVCQRAWAWMSVVFVWARQSAPEFTASAGPCVRAPISTSRLLSAHRRLKVEGVKACIPPEVRIISGRWTQPTAMTEMYIFSISFQVLHLSDCYVVSNSEWTSTPLWWTSLTANHRGVKGRRPTVEDWTEHECEAGLTET